MKIKTFTLIVTLSILFAESSFAQYRIDGVTFLPSIQYRNFIKYGGLQTHDLNTGTVFTKIPLYEYSDRDFTIPVSIDYASSGYVSNVVTGILGLGWYLNAGGCIIREVRGVPDNSEKGFLSVHQSTTTTDWDTLIANNRNESSDPFTTFPDGTETESDLYHFRFLGYSGSFVLGSNGTVYVYNSSHPKGDLSIDFSRLRLDNTITFTTGDGYKYIFGGKFQEDLDKTTELKSNVQQKYNLTWLLSRIESPNGRFVTLSYERSFTQSVFPISYYYDICNTDATTDWTLEYNTPSYDKEFWMANCRQNVYYLSCINIDDTVTIDFEYDYKLGGEYFILDGKKRGLEYDLSLNDIRIKDAANNSIKDISFKYDFFKKANYVTYLSKVILPDGDNYTFSYYKHDSPFPYHATTSIDHWGYMNEIASIRYTPLLPTLSCDSLNNEIVTSTNREPDFEAAVIGMLQKITYPTKGYTVFEYEGNSYSSKVGKNNLTQGLPAIVARNIGGYSYNDLAAYPAGGVRLKKVTDYSSENEARSTEYLYTDKNGNNSGILLYYPRYINGVVTEHDSLSNPLYRKTVIRDGANFINSYVDRHHIEYRSVLEKHPDNSFIQYIFSDYNTIPDELSLMKSAKTLADGNEITVVSPETGYQFNTKVASNDHLRGVLSEKIIHNSNGAIVRKYAYKYDYLNHATSCLSLQRTFSNVYLYKENTNDKFLTEESQIDYFGSDSIIRKHSYAYSDSGRLLAASKKNNDKTIESVTFYADSVQNSPFRNISKETTKWSCLISNELNYPIGQLTYADGKVIQGKIYYYTLLTNEQGKNYCVLSKTGRLKTTGISPDAINGSSFEIESQNDLFASEGQPLQRTGANDCVSAYIWGYGGVYPIAEIVGVPFEIVQQTLGVTKFSNGIFTEEFLSSADEEKLRSIPNALVRTFTYYPLLGVKSITDFNGSKTSYEYTAGGKVSKVTDSNGAVTDEYEYNNSAL